MSQSLTNIFEQDAGALTVEDDKLGGIAQMARRAKILEKEIEELDATISERKAQQRKLLEEVIPEALAEMGMKSFKMDDGSSITIKDFYSASIKEERREEAFLWLRENGYGDIIKNVVSMTFGRGEDELSKGAIAVLTAHGYLPKQEENVHASTLKAWVKERVERGDEFPTETFGAYIGKKATIKSV